MSQKSEKGILGVILASATLTVMAGAIIAPVIQAMIEPLGAPIALIGLVITTHGLFAVIFSPVMGYLIDHVGRKPIYALGLLIYGLGGGSGFFISSFLLMLVSRALLGIGVAALVTSITTLIGDLYKAGPSRNKVMGWRSSANGFGGITYPLIGGFLGSLSWNFPFAVYFVGIPLGLLSLYFIPETIITQPKEETKQPETTSMATLVKAQPILIFIYGLTLLTAIFLYIIVIQVPQLLPELGLSGTAFAGIFLSIQALAAGIISLNYGRIRTYLSYQKIIFIYFLVWAIGFSLLAFASNILFVIIGLILTGIGHGMLLPAIYLWVTEIAPPTVRGKAVSYSTSFAYLGQFLSPVIFGSIFVALGFSTGFLITAIIAGIVLLVLIYPLFKKFS
ncbi:MAG: MFS transporter [Promethearchaeota archaeon]